MSAVRALLRASIDYAGLYPPAGLDLVTTADNYARYKSGEASWALGRLILPAGRLIELDKLAQDRFPRVSPSAWRIAALPGSDLAGDLEQVAEFNQRHAAPERGVAIVDTIELKASSAAGIEQIMQQVPRHLQAYIEIPIEQDPAPLIRVIGRSGARAKVRTGGVTRDAFPGTAELLRFLRTSVLAGVPFKATAGLHHALRAEYRLTYETGSPNGTMFGFLNLFLATAFLRAGLAEDQVTEVLEERSPGAFHFGRHQASWRGQQLDQDQLRHTRDLLVSFGSCSFTEPIGELHALGLLEPGVPQA